MEILNFPPGFGIPPSKIQILEIHVFYFIYYTNETRHTPLLMEDVLKEFSVVRFN